MRLPAEELGNLLRAHGYVNVERPPALWDVETTGLQEFVRALGEMLAAGLVRNGNELRALTLAIANVRVSPDAGGPVPTGDLVAVSVSGRGDWTDSTWQPGSAAGFVSLDLPGALDAAGAVHGYSRRVAGGSGSVSVLYQRWRP
jgi:hypothetical protein